MRNKIFGRLLKAGINSAAMCEGKTAPIIEAELGQEIGVSGSTIQRYKAGYIPPEYKTVRILAELAVKRGRLNRDWLREFLSAAQYPSADKLIASLYPDIIGDQSNFRHNLPPPSYSQFIMRTGMFTEIANGLNQRSAVVLITGLAGMGKTSLAREVASDCLKGTRNVPKFDAVVWVSDKDHPGELILNDVVDEILRVLDYNGFTTMEIKEKCYEVEKIFRQQRILLIIDNFETINDIGLSAWLLRLPEPSKVLVTSRKYSRLFRNNTFVIELQGMNEDETQYFALQRAKLLRIDHLIPDFKQLDPLIKITGGNPKSIEMVLGYIKYERRPLPDLIDDLFMAKGELFEDLFERSWGSLNEGARRILLVVPLFQNSMDIKSLSAIADVSGVSLVQSIDRLVDLSLLNVQQTDLNIAPRYTVHPLVRAFAQSKLDQDSNFRDEVRERWISWYIQLGLEVGYCWHDISRLQILDPEADTIHSILVWTLENSRYSDVINLARGVGYYYFIRGLWNKTPMINLAHAESAHAVNNIVEEIQALSYHIQILSRQGQVTEAQNYLKHLYHLSDSLNLSGDVFFNLQHAIALNALTSHDFDKALNAWRKSLDISS